MATHRVASASDYEMQFKAIIGMLGNVLESLIDEYEEDAKHYLEVGDDEFSASSEHLAKLAKGALKSVEDAEGLWGLYYNIC